jgi:hypothetical protein
MYDISHAALATLLAVAHGYVPRKGGPRARPFYDLVTKTAKALGLTFSTAPLGRANEVTE